MKNMLFVPLLLVNVINASAQSGNMLDKKFADQGTFITQNSSNIEFTSVVSKADRSFVVGHIENFGFDGGDLTLSGYNEDGSINTAFGNGGSALVQYQSQKTYRANQMLKLSDERVVSFVRLQGDRCALYCSKKNGLPDSSFGRNGWTLVNRYTTDIALLNGDTIVTVSYKYFPSDSVFHIFQFFTKKGKLVKEFSVFVGYPWRCNDFNAKTVRLATTNDNKIISAGWARWVGDGPSRKGIFLVRLLPSGKLDSTFNQTGIKLDSTKEDFLIALAVDKSNRTMLAAELSIKCLNVNGDVDSGYGTKGTVSCFFSRNNFETFYLSDIKIQADNKMVACGVAFTGFYGKNTFALVRYKDNGVVDSSFGLNGTAGTFFRENGLRLNSVSKLMAVQNDNKILCIGSARLGDAGTISHGAIARYLPEKITRPLLSNTLGTVTKNSLLRTYPNPVQNIITISGLNLNSKYTVSIINMSGNQVYSTSFIHNTINKSIDVSLLPAGIYFIITQDAEGKTTHTRFQKE